ncbi:sigma-70 family RNA polymerase sigma factor [Candidatus Cyanaurora vandensis]|uniref:sigma-70 family RNA polymerase sigma factor n=1 Tax=Candidatus Cyanaurora vandensis TaxID=2714958 RepID=UPI002580F2F7|nr:sigma-70 family RNA polymerase sigma factor [Candidatus Cyanaurora vandensis]
MTLTPDRSTDVTELLLDWRNGNSAALARLIPLVHAELHRIARSYLRQERTDHTLQATALINEAYLKLVDQTRVPWQNRAHFIAVSAQMMRRILVDHARSHRAEKRGGDLQKISLDDALGVSARERDVDLVALDEALTQLARLDTQQCQIVELRYFGGLTIEETATVLSISSATVKRDWSMARAWLRRELTP